ncbi:hypothetical protein Hanom_Chr12g01166841 [Helianthus anomalus]
MILKYMYMLYVCLYVCVRRFCPLVDRLERPNGDGEDAAAGDGGGEEMDGGSAPHRDEGGTGPITWSLMLKDELITVFMS